MVKPFLKNKLLERVSVPAGDARATEERCQKKGKGQGSFRPELEFTECKSSEGTYKPQAGRFPLP